MPLSSGYERYFIILGEEEKGYEVIGGKLPTGYVNVERRGNKVKVKGLIQNIRVGTKSDYRLYLAAPKDREYIEIGRFRMDKEKGEVFSELDLTKNMVTCRYTAALVIAGESIVLYGGKEQEKADILDWFYQKHIKKDEAVEEKVSLEETKTDRLIEKEVPKVTEEVIQERIVTEETLEVDMEGIEERAEEGLKEITDIVEDETSRAIVEEFPKVTEMTDQNISDKEEQSKEEIKEKEEEEEFFTGEGSRQFEELPFTHRFHQIDVMNDEPENQRAVLKDELDCHEEKASTNRYPEIAELLKNLKKTDGIEGMDNQSWFAVDNKLHLFNDITVDINGTKMPLSYPYFIKGCGPWINDGLLGVDYEGNMIKRLLIGLLGVYINHWEPYFKAKGFAKYGRDAKCGKGYWIMCIDLDKRDIQN